MGRIRLCVCVCVCGVNMNVDSTICAGVAFASVAWRKAPHCSGVGAYPCRLTTLGVGCGSTCLKAAP